MLGVEGQFEDVRHELQVGSAEELGEARPGPAGCIRNKPITHRIRMDVLDGVMNVTDPAHEAVEEASLPEGTCGASTPIQLQRRESFDGVHDVADGLFGCGEYQAVPVRGHDNVRKQPKAEPPPTGPKNVEESGALSRRKRTHAFRNIAGHEEDLVRQGQSSQAGHGEILQPLPLRTSPGSAGCPRVLARARLRGLPADCPLRNPTIREQRIVPAAGQAKPQVGLETASRTGRSRPTCATHPGSSVVPDRFWNTPRTRKNALFTHLGPQGRGRPESPPGRLRGLPAACPSRKQPSRM